MTLATIEARTRNRDTDDRTRVIAKLEAGEGDDAQATAEWMKKVLPWPTRARELGQIVEKLPARVQADVK